MEVVNGLSLCPNLFGFLNIILQKRMKNAMSSLLFPWNHLDLVPLEKLQSIWEAIRTQKLPFQFHYHWRSVPMGPS
uniref:Uncharacterized protein n=1 Tax=Rhizophora mucronata TaxID=61149 RepID=A0A2P2PJD7_RHIMU